MTSAYVNAYRGTGEAYLRRRILAASVLLLFVGIIVMWYSNVSKDTFIPEKIEESIREVRYFDAEDMFDIYIAPGENWANSPLEPPTDIAPYSSCFVYINVMDPEGNTTGFEFDFGLYGGGLFLYNITTNPYESSPSSYISIISLKPLRCEAEISGNYTGKIWGIFPGISEPPAAFQLRKLNVKAERPYSYLLPIGLVVFASGIVTLASSRLSPFKTKKKQSKKIKTPRNSQVSRQ